jgi:hypothetical protein
MRQAWHRDYQLGVLRTSHHHLSFDARNQRAATNVLIMTQNFLSLRRHSKVTDQRKLEGGPAGLIASRTNKIRSGFMIY